ncbi:MAG TPA: hypothetical protein VMW08_00200 [Acidimicrobiales bacterium]|nr:hypothetical protein [Acidimicrobiales bacterium]
MACGCGKGKKATTAEEPLILGEDFGESRQVRATVHILGIAAQEVAWVRGSKVDFYIEHQWLQAVTN